MAYGDEYIEDSWYGEGNRLANVAITVPGNLGTTMLLALVTGRSTSSNPEFITGFSWEGDPFTAIGGHEQYDTDGEGEVYSYYLLNPDIAGPANVSMAYDSDNDHDTLCSIILLKKVELEAPVGWAFAGGGGTSKTTSGIATIEGNLMFHLGGMFSTVGAISFGADQFLGHSDYFDGTAQESTHVWSHKRAASASESMQTIWETTRDFGFGAFSVAVKRETAQQIIVAL